jgi:hypothetical protein
MRNSIRRYDDEFAGLLHREKSEGRLALREQFEKIKEGYVGVQVVLEGMLSSQRQAKKISLKTQQSEA